MKTIFAMMILIGFASTSSAQASQLTKLDCTGEAQYKSNNRPTGETLAVKGLSKDVVSVDTVSANGIGTQFLLTVDKNNPPRANMIGGVIYKFDITIRDYHEMGSVGSATAVLPRIKGNPGRLELNLKVGDMTQNVIAQLECR